MNERFGGDSADNMHLDIAYTYNDQIACEYRDQVMEAFPGFTDIRVDPLSLSVSTHIGPGALALACSKKISL